MGKLTRTKMEYNVKILSVSKVERYFSDSTTVTFEEIMKSLIKEKVDQCVNPSYHDQQVNVATSDGEVA